MLRALQRLLCLEEVGRRRARAERLGLECLEDRWVPSTFMVDTFADVVADDGQTSLREAIALAASKPGNDVIKLPAGTYPLALGQLTIDDSSGTVSLRADAGVATIDAQFASRAFEVTAASEVRLKGLTITRGLAALGGGVFNAGVLRIDDASFTANLGFAIGGGIYNAGTIEVARTVFDGNSSGLGGGIYNVGAATITDSTFTGNIVSGQGGGVFNVGTMAIKESDFAGNRSASGGAVHNLGNLDVKGGAITGNLVGGGLFDPGRGGGVFNAGTATIKAARYPATSSNWAKEAAFTTRRSRPLP
jgi:predicted outer membrane repeat protein